LRACGGGRAAKLAVDLRGVHPDVARRAVVVVIVVTVVIIIVGCRGNCRVHRGVGAKRCCGDDNDDDGYQGWCCCLSPRIVL